jgi:hypothetical protein
MWGNFARMSGAEIALELAGSIARFEERSDGVIAAARSELVATTQFLEERRNVWEGELARRQEALDTCLSRVTEDGPPNCSAYAAARDEAQAKIDALFVLIRRVEEAGSGFEAGAGRFQQELASTCPAARAELHRLSGVVGGYEG